MADNPTKVRAANQVGVPHKKDAQNLVFWPRPDEAPLDALPLLSPNKQHRHDIFETLIKLTTRMNYLLGSIRKSAINGKVGHNLTVLKGNISSLRGSHRSLEQYLNEPVKAEQPNDRPYSDRIITILNRLAILTEAIDAKDTNWDKFVLQETTALEQVLEDFKSVLLLEIRNLDNTHREISTPPIENQLSITYNADELYSQRQERRPLDVVSSWEQLYDLLQVRCGMTPGVQLTNAQLKLASETAFNAVVAGVIDSPSTFRDPVSGLTFPPIPREIDFQSRGKVPSGRRMTYDEYLADKVQGWGEYTQQHMLTSSWLNDLDRPLYMALMYQANKEAEETGVPDVHTDRTAAHDRFFLRHGILTPGHLERPPTGYETQAKTLLFATKIALELPKGRRPRGSQER